MCVIWLLTFNVTNLRLPVGVRCTVFTGRSLNKHLIKNMAGKGGLERLDVGVLSTEQQEKLRQFKVT